MSAPARDVLRGLALVFVIVASTGAGACTSSDGSSSSSGTSGTSGTISPTMCPNDLPTCSSTPPSYAKDVSAAFQSACTPCHTPTGVQSGRVLTDYADVFRQRSAVLNQLNACRMPPVDAPPITAAERTMILTWLECNAPNN